MTPAARRRAAGEARNRAARGNRRCGACLRCVHYQGATAQPFRRPALDRPAGRRRGMETAPLACTIMDQSAIVIRGAREHNLQNVDLELPRNRLICFTGVSGSGKSSLAFDTLYAE